LEEEEEEEEEEVVVVVEVLEVVGGFEGCRDAA